MTSGQDPTLYAGTARNYWARPPYAAGLPGVLAPAGRSSGRLLDVGCGPGVLALLLADRFDDVVGLDPDSGMLAEASRLAAERDINNIRWVQGLAEDIPSRVVGPFNLVAFGQSFHWTDREAVSDLLFDVIEPGGALAVISHNHTHCPPPPGPGLPLVPHDAIHALIRRYLGDRRRAGDGFLALPDERHEDVLRRSRFGEAQVTFIPGRTDLVVSIEHVLTEFLSMSFAAPRLFGERLPSFEEEFRAELAARSPGGLFWDWPGDTEVILARKSRKNAT